MNLPLDFTKLTEIANWVKNNNPKSIIIKKNCKAKTIWELNPNYKGPVDPSTCYYGLWNSFHGIPIIYK